MPSFTVSLQLLKSDGTLKSTLVNPVSYAAPLLAGDAPASDRSLSPLATGTAPWWP